MKKRELLARKGKGASLAREIEALEARLARERGEMEAQRDAEVAQARRPEQERLDAYEAEVMQEEATLRKLLATLEQTYGERAKEVKARLDGALEQTRARWRGPLQEAERAARRSRPLRRWFGVYLPVAALLAAGGAWLATLAPLRQGLLAALADLELLLRSRFLTPDSLIDLLPQTTAAASLLPLALLASRMLLGRGDRGAAAEFARLRDEHGREVLASRQAADERLAAIARERDTRRAEPQARIDAIEARRAAHRSARDAAGEAVKRRHDARIDSHVRGLQAQIEERQRRLDAFQVGLRNLSAQRDFPAYKTAKRRGYQDGEKPSSAERERVAQRQVEAFLRLLSDSDRQILAMLANRLSEEQMGKVYELLNQAGSSGARSVILRALVRDF